MWVQRFTQMRQDPPDRPRIGDEADQPDIATTVGTHHRKLLTHPCQQLGPGNPRRVVVARLSINDSSRTAAATPRASQDTGMLACLRVSLLADIPDGKRRDGLPQPVVRRNTPSYRCRCRRGGGISAASRSRNSNGVSSMTPLAPGRVDFRERPGPTQFPHLCRGRM